MSREPGRTAADVLIGQVKTLPDCASVAEARDQFADDHVHMVLLVRDGLGAIGKLGPDFDDLVRRSATPLMRAAVLLAGDSSYA